MILDKLSLRADTPMPDVRDPRLGIYRGDCGPRSVRLRTSGEPVLCPPALNRAFACASVYIKGSCITSLDLK